MSGGMSQRCNLLPPLYLSLAPSSIRHSENKNIMQLTLSESEVKAAVQ